FACAGAAALAAPAGRNFAGSRAVVAGHGSEGCLGFPGHVGIGVAQAAIQYLDKAHAAHVQVALGMLSMRQVMVGKGADEGCVNVVGGEELQELAQIGGLLLLVAEVVTVEAYWCPAVVFDDCAAAGSLF